MTGQPDVRFVLVVGAISIAVMTIAAHLGWRGLAGAAAAVFTLALIWTAMRANARLAATRGAETGGMSGTAAAAGRLNALLMALAYGWGGAAMLAIYLLSGLKWQHGWQYGLGMIVIAAGLVIYSRQLTEQVSPMTAMRALNVTALMAMAQAAAAAVALVVLVMSGKLQTFRDDWAANHIFVAGGLAVVVLSVIAVLSHRRATRQD